MDFTLNEQEEAIRTMASKFARVELKKVAIEVEENDQPPSREIVRKFAKQGLLGVNLQTKYGGGGLGHFEAVGPGRATQYGGDGMLLRLRSLLPDAGNRVWT